ncbi:MAG: hypothetical protein QM758_05010 [Armatimonas sp.]
MIPSATGKQGQSIPQTPEEKARQEKEAKARKYEFEFGQETARGTGFVPDVGKFARLAPRGREGFDQVSTGSVLVGLERPSVLTLLRLGELESIKRVLDEGELKATDFAAALARTKSVVDKDVADGKLFPLPYGTRIRILEFRTPGFVPPPAGGPELSKGERALEQLMRSGLPIFGTYLVEVLEGSAKGKQVWTDAARALKPLRGDTVYLQLPKYPNLSVPLAPEQPGLFSDEVNGMLPPAGRVSEPKARARFDRLVREKWLILLPQGTACKVVADSDENKLCAVSPLSGPEKNNRLVVRLDHITLRLPGTTKP